MKHLLRILSSTKQLWRYYLAIAALSAIVSMLQLVQPVVTGSIIDTLRAGKSADNGRIVFLVLLLFMQDGGTSLLNNINGYLGDQMGSRLQKILGEKYYAHLVTLPQSYFDKEMSGKIIGRLNRGTQQIAQFINMFANNFLQFVLTTVFSLILAAYYSWIVALVLMALYPIFVFMTIKTSNKWQKWQAERNDALDIANGRFAETMTQVKVAKSFQQEQREVRFYSKYLKKYVEIGRPQSRFWHLKDIERRMVLAVVFLGVYMLIFLQAAKGNLTPGEAVTLMLVAFQIRFPIFSISFLVDNTQRAMADSKDYFEVLSQIPEVRSADGKALLVDSGKVDFSDVVFGYDEKQVLKGVNFSIEPSSKIALVGESGEGKTTITSLLLGFYRPDAGAILIDGQDIAEVSTESLRQNIGVVFQEASLFSGTIKENIGYANPKASDKQIAAAAKAANAHEFISKLDNGYDTEIGERGLKLSGGQKQRIAIARALLKNAPILVLDEATSSLDNKSEILVQEALERLMKGRTTIIIAHRLTTIQNVDQIITLKNGKVDEIGSPAELAKTKGIYAELLSINKRPKSEDAKKKLNKFEISA